MSTLAEIQQPRLGETDAVVRAQAGDGQAFAELYERYRNYIMTIIVDSVDDPHTQHDVLQATFERAWAKIDTLRDPAAFKSWAAQITRRLLVDQHREGSRIVQTDFGDTETTPEIVDQDWAADEWASMRELASAVNAAVADLTPRDATVLELSSTFGFSPAEIAEALQVDTGHARVLVHRARQRLRAAVFPTDGV